MNDNNPDKIVRLDAIVLRQNLLVAAQNADAQYSELLLSATEWHREGRVLRGVRDNNYWKILGFLSFPDYYRKKNKKINHKELSKQINKKIDTSLLFDFIEKNSSYTPPDNFSMAVALRYYAPVHPLRKKLSKEQLFQYLSEIWGFFCDHVACELEQGGDDCRLTVKSFSSFVAKFEELDCIDANDGQQENDDHAHKISVDDVIEVILSVNEIIENNIFNKTEYLLIYNELEILIKKIDKLK